MGHYVDGFVLPVARSRVEDYRKLAEEAGRIWKEHGALQFWECVADDVQPGKLTSFPQAVQLKEDETVVFSFIVYASREERDRVNAAVMADSRLNKDPNNLPFDAARMFWGGFRTLVEL